MNKLSEQSGFSIVSALMTSVVLIGVAAGLIAIVITMFRSSTREQAENAADEAMALVEMIISNRTFAGNALQTSGGAPVHYDSSSPSIDIQIINLQNTSSGPGPLSALVKGQNITPKLILSSITFRQTVPATGTPITINGTSYKAYSGSLVLTFSNSADFIGGVLKPRSIAVTVLVGDITGTIDLCYESVSVQQICQQMGGTMDPTYLKQAKAPWMTLDSGPEVTPRAVDALVQSGDLKIGRASCRERV